MALNRRKQDNLLVARPNPLVKYANDPVAFVHDCVKWREGEKPAFYQDEIMSNLLTYRRESVRGPHGLGKTFTVALTVLWFALTNDGVTDWKIPITASAWRQLTHYAMPEIHKWARRLDWNKIGRPPFNERSELLALNIKLRTGECFALASDNSALIEGAHASRMLYVFDESKEIPDGTWDSAEGAFSAGDCYWLSVSTPGEPIGRFFDIQSRRAGYEDWHVRAVTLAEAVAAGRVAEGWAEQRRQQWGEESAVYQNRVLGEFASSEAEGVIPLSWIEKANQRWLEWRDAGLTGLPFRCVGADIARSGEDKTVLALRHENVITELRSYTLQDTMETAGRIKAVLDMHGGRGVVDVIGIGAGVYDRLKEMNYEVVPFNASERTDLKDLTGEMLFTNCRSAAWWRLREMLDPHSGNDIALPPDDLLTGDLVAPHWRVTSGGKIQIEPKEDIKKRIGRSTDSGDAVVMAFWEQGLPSVQNWISALKRRNKKSEDKLWDY